MPSGTIHRYFSHLVTGRDSHNIDRVMDSTTRTHPGKRHRNDMVHSGAFIIGQMGADPDAGIFYLMHSTLDKNWRVREMQPMERLPEVRKFRHKRILNRPHPHPTKWCDCGPCIGARIQMMGNSSSRKR